MGLFNCWRVKRGFDKELFFAIHFGFRSKKDYKFELNFFGFKISRILGVDFVLKIES